ncbi:unnamed protein product [Vitrella brassicaformis CCMP3155]|uniref:Uncharacterized protein n=1 Tax=Vitrella brassicaformis (strain CCMP3155) TaxID=1169540 RepID=A0A0G4F4I9_VITBC|nr:unnamed protein product [Vitrella brassicaformis CCMP3155]|eukprot:CEM06811.1 unnamed protein product [Vitrella brassicaformis CCMP3155]
MFFDEPVLTKPDGIQVRLPSLVGEGTRGAVRGGYVNSSSDFRAFKIGVLSESTKGVFKTGGEYPQPQGYACPAAMPQGAGRGRGQVDAYDTGRHQTPPTLPHNITPYTNTPDVSRDPHVQPSSSNAVDNNTAMNPQNAHFVTPPGPQFSSPPTNNTTSQPSVPTVPPHPSPSPPPPRTPTTETDTHTPTPPVAKAQPYVHGVGPPPPPSDEPPTAIQSLQMQYDFKIQPLVFKLKDKTGRGLRNWTSKGKYVISSVAVTGTCRLKASSVDLQEPIRLSYAVERGAGSGTVCGDFGADMYPAHHETYQSAGCSAYEGRQLYTVATYDSNMRTFTISPSAWESVRSAAVADLSEGRWEIDVIMGYDLHRSD